MRCPKCSGDMEPGFIVDRAHANLNRQAAWVEGVATAGFWPDSVKMRGREALPVTTFRCHRCGYLESFAEQDQ
jgi:hypothetical protein